MKYEEIEFDENLYQKNIEENDFSGSEEDGIGEEIDVSKIKVEMESDEDANN